MPPLASCLPPLHLFDVNAICIIPQIGGITSHESLPLFSTVCAFARFVSLQFVLPKQADRICGSIVPTHVLSIAVEHIPLCPLVRTSPYTLHNCLAIVFYLPSDNVQT